MGIIIPTPPTLDHYALQVHLKRKNKVCLSIICWQAKISTGWHLQMKHTTVHEVIALPVKAPYSDDIRMIMQSYKICIDINLVIKFSKP
jgi:hypothetical protein